MMRNNKESANALFAFLKLQAYIYTFIIFCLHPQALGPYLFRFQCFSQLLRAFKVCFMHTKTKEKRKLITERNALFNLAAEKKKNKINKWAFTIRQQSLLISGNALNFFPLGCKLHNDAHSCAVIRN